MFFKRTYFRLPPGGVFRHCALKFAKKSRMKRSIDLPQARLMNFRVEYVKPQSGRCLDEGLFRKCKRSSALSTLHNGSFRKLRYFAFFVVVVVVVVVVVLLPYYLNVLIWSYSQLNKYFHIGLITFPFSSAEARVSLVPCLKKQPINHCLLMFVNWQGIRFYSKGLLLLLSSWMCFLVEFDIK